MTIGINANEANVVHRVGINQLAFELLSHLLPNPDIRVYLSENPMADMPLANYEVFGPKKMWTLTGLQKKVLLDPPDILFSLTHYAPPILRVPSVVSIMDLAFEKFPQFFKKNDLLQLKLWSRLSASQASHIITISENSKRDIVDLYGISSDKISVIYPGYDESRFNKKVKPDKKYGDYILFLGTLQPRKNVERLIQAFYQLKANSLKLVIVGMKNEGRGGWMNENIRGDDRVILTGYLPDEKIPGLMAGAKAYVLPSLYEGFGIPPIEAMAVGTPVCVTRVSSLPEICGEAASYIEDPYSVDSIKIALEDVLKNGSKKVQLGLKLVKKYNWEDAAKQTMNVLRGVVAK